MSIFGYGGVMLLVVNPAPDSRLVNELLNRRDIFSVFGVRSRLQVTVEAVSENRSWASDIAQA